jgi:hypothetical protein
MFTVEDVQQAINTAFPEEQRADVRAALDEYRHGEFFDSPRVCMAILALSQLLPSGERLRAVRESVAMANIDPRDVVVAAESPDQVGAPQSRQQMRAAYRALGVRRSPV